MNFRLFYSLSLSCLLLVILIFSSASIQKQQNTEKRYKMRLSEYGFFEGNVADMLPVDDVLPYELPTPLFTDYAHKARFVKFPEGKQATYDSKNVLDFPEGTTIIKTFYFPHDARKPEKGRRLMETRLLVKNAEGWDAIPYVWDDEQTDAYLDVAGDTKEVQWRDEHGKKRKQEYIIPNKNQCKGCHIRGKAMTPIGPTARQLNSDMVFQDGKMNQLVKWQQEGYLKDLPENLADVPKIAKWDDPHESLNDRARAWLDINCGHCHNPDGPANTSGLMLDIHETDMGKLGIYKTPVAAGRGAGGHDYDILPGKPDESILMYRMISTDPGVMMPEIARTLTHAEGVQLIRDWIEAMDAGDYEDLRE